MTKVERATLKLLQELYNTGELPLPFMTEVEIQHRVSNKTHGQRTYKINIRELPYEYSEDRK